MNDMNDIINKIKNLLSLSNSPNMNEASIALAKAYNLLTKYNIDINTINTTEKKVKDIIDIPYLESKRIRQWKISLVIEIAKTNYCVAYRNIGLNHINKIETMLINLVGTEINVQATKIMADYIFTAIDYQTKKRVEKKELIGLGSIESFKVGYATTIVERLKMLKDMSINNPDCKELTIVQDNKVQDFMNNIKLSKSIIDVSIVDVNGYVKGRKIGYDLSLEKQIKQDTKDMIE